MSYTGEEPEFNTQVTGDDTDKVATTAFVQQEISAAATSTTTLVPHEYDEIVNTYVGATTSLNTVEYKLATVTVATLTMSYDGSGRLVGVVRS